MTAYSHFLHGLVLAVKLMGGLIFVAFCCVVAWSGAHSHSSERYALQSVEPSDEKPPVLGSEGTA